MFATARIVFLSLRKNAVFFHEDHLTRGHKLIFSVDFRPKSTIRPKICGRLQNFVLQHFYIPMRTRPWPGILKNPILPPHPTQAHRPFGCEPRGQTRSQSNDQTRPQNKTQIHSPRCPDGPGGSPGSHDQTTAPKDDPHSIRHETTHTVAARRANRKTSPARAASNGQTSGQ